MGSFQWEIDFMTALQGASGKVLTPIIEGVSMPLAAFLRREYCSEERAAGRTGVPLREVFVCVFYCHGDLSDGVQRY